jgi:hypothetical protein
MGNEHRVRARIRRKLSKEAQEPTSRGNDQSVERSRPKPWLSACPIITLHRSSAKLGLGRYWQMESNNLASEIRTQNLGNRKGRLVLNEYSYENNSRHNNVGRQLWASFEIGCVEGHHAVLSRNICRNDKWIQ